MKQMLTKTCLLGAGLLFSSLCYASSPPTGVGAAQLFSFEQRRINLQTNTTGYLRTLLDDPASKDVLLVDVQPALISNETRTLAITLPNGKTATFNLETYSALAEGMEGWVGYKPSAVKSKSASELKFDPLYYLSIVRQGDQLVGEIMVDGQRYRLEYVSPGQHALVAIDEAKLAPQDALPEAKGVAAQAASVQPHATSEHSTIRLMFVTTQQSRAKYPNPRLTLNQALQDVNQTMKNSKVNITFELAGIYAANYDESGKEYSKLLNDVTYYMKDVAQARDGMLADLVSMIVVNNSLCGGGKPGPSKAAGFTAVTCLSSLAHEIGHNFGMVHNSGGARTPSYIHGYRWNQSAFFPFRTQMSYECTGRSCPRIAYFSNPRLSYAGVPMGTVKDNDVARALNERRGIVENFYPSPADSAKIKVFEQSGFRGKSCEMYLQKDSVTIVKDSLCRSLTTSRSAKIENFQAGNTLCLRNTDDSRNRCFTGAYTGNFEINNFDLDSAWPGELKRSVKGWPMNGSVTQVSYEKTGDTFVRLYAEENFKSPLCTVTVGEGETVTLNTEARCPSNVGRSRSAQVLGFDGSKVCFTNADAKRKHCYSGPYQGDFSIRNYDVSNLNLPKGLAATRSGYMNSNAYRISKGVE